MTTAYDKIIYPNRCHAQTHPDRLAVIGELLGLSPAAPERCRMLEIGCGDGTNLLPLAYLFPESHFVGIDLARTRIDAGCEAIRDLGLKNIELRHLDVTKFPIDGDTFDYVVAHGVYSWVPAEVREALLTICRGRLARQGVAFVSYNCLPGGHIRRLVRDIMRFHIRALQDPREQVQQSVAITQLIANSLEKPDTYRQIFKEQLEQIQRYGGGHLFHDDLADVNDSFYFHEFIQHAARHGLQYLAEADFFEMQDQSFTPEARAALGQMEDSRLTREQYLDFIKCRRFRQTLLCHHETALRYPPDPSAIEHFHISSEARAATPWNGSSGKSIERFVEPRGGALEVDYPLAKAAFHILGQNWPATISFRELWAASTQLQPPGGDSNEPGARQNLLAILLEAYRAGIVEFRRTSVRCLAQPSARPRVWPFARWQVQRSGMATTLRSDNLRVEDDEGKRLLQLLDGSRSLEEIRHAFDGGARPSGGIADGAGSQLRERVMELGRLALLEA